MVTRDIRVGKESKITPKILPWATAGQWIRENL